MQNPLDKGLEKKIKNIAHFCLFYAEIKMMKAGNILNIWLSPICKNKFSKFFFGYQIRKIKSRKMCLFETLHPQKFILH